MNFSLIIELAKRDFIERIFRFGPGFHLVIHISSHQHPYLYDHFREPYGRKVARYILDMRIWIYLVPRARPLDCICKYGNTMINCISYKKNIIAKIHMDLPTVPFYIIISESMTFAVTLVIFLLILQ